MLPPSIALEEHFISYLIGPDKVKEGQPDVSPLVDMHPPAVLEKLYDIGDKRIQDMDEGKLSRQVISHAPNSLNVGQCEVANNKLAEAVTKHPDRFSGFATLPVTEPDNIGSELRRCVQELGFVGALIDNHANGAYYDGLEYSGLWEAAQELDVPIYLHPVMPTNAVLQALYQGNYSSQAALSIGTFGFGWHSDVAVHILRLFSAGVFDRFPKVKIIIGHFGEMLPFMLERIIHLSPLWSRELHRSFKTIWDENIYITTSGIWGISPMACILKNTKIDRILFSVDFPFESNKSGMRYLEELQESGLVTEEQLAMISYKNAQRLLKVNISLHGIGASTETDT